MEGGVHWNPIYSWKAFHLLQVSKSEGQDFNSHSIYGFRNKYFNKSSFAINFHDSGTEELLKRNGYFTYD